MNKICLITHVADPDGAFPIILAKLVFQEMDVYSVDIDEVDDILKEALKKDYDKIYIVDLCMSDEMASTLKDTNLVEVYDHHGSRIHLNQYPFIHIVVEQNGVKESGTSLYYQYLKTQFKSELLEKEVVKEMVELVRQNDTFDFTEEKKDAAFSFRNLYDIYGRENYIEHFYQFILEHDVFEFTDVERTLITLEQERSERYVKEKLENVIFTEIEGIPVGIVFAEQNRSMLGHKMALEFKDKIDIAIVINVDRSISYRADKEEIDVNVLAGPYGGGGHKHAGGSPLPIDLQEKIIEHIFKNVEWRKEY